MPSSSALVYWFAFSLRSSSIFRTRTGSRCGSRCRASWSSSLIVFYYVGHCHRSWYSVSFSDLVALFHSATLSTSGHRWRSTGCSCSSFIRRAACCVLDWALTILVLGGLRAVGRLSREELSPRLWRSGYRKALIVGANQSGETLARHLLSDRRLKYQPVGYLDHDPARVGSTLGGIPVLGRAAQALADCQPPGRRRHAGDLRRADRPAIAQPDGRLCAAPASRSRSFRPTTTCWPATTRRRFATSTSTTCCAASRSSSTATRSARLVAGRTVLVTGAGGSIGSEICRQVLKFRPKALVLVERAENSLFLVEQEFRASADRSPRDPLHRRHHRPRSASSQIFAQHRPAIVFHAAAHKHVPMMEYNPGEAIKNNVLGTRQLAELADEHGVQEFVMISTDKAVNPTSIMGVSKQLAERFVHAFSEAAEHEVRRGSLRQRAGLERQRGADLPGADSPRRTDHGHASRDRTLLHDHSRGLAARAAGRRDGQGGRDLRARHGRVGADRRSGPRPDPPLGPASPTTSRSSSPACGRARSCTKSCTSTTRRCSRRRIRSCSSPITGPTRWPTSSEAIAEVAALDARVARRLAAEDQGAGRRVFGSRRRRRPRNNPAVPASPRPRARPTPAAAPAHLPLNPRRWPTNSRPPPLSVAHSSRVTFSILTT